MISNFCISPQKLFLRNRSRIQKYFDFQEENGPYILGDQLTLVDMVWFPTLVFMEFMMPVVFEWPEIFNSGEHGFPKLSAWYTYVKTNDDPIFPQVHKQIWDFWVTLLIKNLI